MVPPLMPKATAVWLVENTALSFEQIADFCGLHILEVRAIADGEVGVGMRGLAPVANGPLAWDELERCEADTQARLPLRGTHNPTPVHRTNWPPHVPVSKNHAK